MELDSLLLVKAHFLWINSVGASRCDEGLSFSNWSSMVFIKFKEWFVYLNQIQIVFYSLIVRRILIIAIRLQVLTFVFIFTEVLSTDLVVLLWLFVLFLSLITRSASLFIACVCFSLVMKWLRLLFHTSKMTSYSKESYVLDSCLILGLISALRHLRSDRHCCFLENSDYLTHSWSCFNFTPHVFN